MADVAVTVGDDGQRSKDLARSRRSRPVRARTENLRAARRQLAILPFEPFPDVERPRTRGDCASVERPCPFVSCRHSLYLEVAGNGSIKLRFPDLEPNEMPADASCVLDVADRGGASLQETADALNMVRERVRQIQREAFVKACDESPELRECLPEQRPERKTPEEPPMTDTTPKPPEGRTIDLDLSCPLTEGEIAAKGELVAALHEESVVLRAKRRELAAEMASAIKGKEHAILALVTQLRSRSEIRPVRCSEELDFRTGVVIVRRTDSGVVVSSRPMTKGERQTNLFPIDGGKRKAREGEARDEVTP